MVESIKQEHFILERTFSTPLVIFDWQFVHSSLRMIINCKCWFFKRNEYFSSYFANIIVIYLNWVYCSISLFIVYLSNMKTFLWMNPGTDETFISISDSIERIFYTYSRCSLSGIDECFKDTNQDKKEIKERLPICIVQFLFFCYIFYTVSVITFHISLETVILYFRNLALTVWFTIKILQKFAVSGNWKPFNQ